MADEREIDTDQPIKNADMNRFLIAKAPEKPCPECGTNEWHTSSTPDIPEGSDEPDVAIGYIMAAKGPYALPVATLHCGNCGYVKVFLASTVKAWLKSNG